MGAVDVESCCVAEVMGTELYTLTPDTLVASAQRLAKDNGVEHLLVLDNGSLAGIVCRHDLHLAARDALVGECMSSPVLCISPDTTVTEAAQIMSEHDVGCLPVVTGSFLVGIVTRDVLAEAGLGPRKEPEQCVACLSSNDVRRDPRAGGLPLCADCLGRTSAGLSSPAAD